MNSETTEEIVAPSAPHCGINIKLHTTLIDAPIYTPTVNLFCILFGNKYMFDAQLLNPIIINNTAKSCTRITHEANLSPKNHNTKSSATAIIPTHIGIDKRRIFFTDVSITLCASSTLFSASKFAIFDFATILIDNKN